ncbi:MAG: exonuclease SbcCD subunit D [Ruminococcus sp.]|nr:exonuclease SbcCD subunit D [Ruminococcus sp.]HBB20532.1 exonuclease sbcCD subunit D [Ruminococcus sp.]
MKIIHLSDLHIGKKLREMPLVEDQRHILGKILDITSQEQPDCVIIAGDIYDRSAPPAEAVAMFDDFLTSLAELGKPVMLISGNHDSPERIAFGGRIMEKRGVYFSPVYSGKVAPITLTDQYGPVDFWLLPFIRPATVRPFFEDMQIQTYNDAVSAAVGAMELDKSRRNVIAAHQFVTGAYCCDSEEISVGGTENVDAAIFADFDYTALGHIHNPQNIGENSAIRYCGTPLKYSFSEANRDKSVTVVELGQKGQLEVRQVPLEPLHEVRELRGSFQEIWQEPYSEDLLHIVLTDEEETPDALGKLRVRFPALLHLEYDNKRTRALGTVADGAQISSRAPSELFAEFYSLRNGQELTEEQSQFVESLIKEIWEGEE